MSDVFTEVESAVRSYSRSWPATFVRASGAKQWAEDGTEYIDFFSGAGALNYGHNDPAVIEPLIAYLQSGAVLHSLDMQTPAKREFLETFSELILKPRSLDYKVMFPGPTGTNTVEAALKLARKATGRQHILSFTNAFHGMTLGSLSVTGNAMKRRGAGIPLTHTSRLPYDGYLASGQSDFEWLENVLEDSGSGVDKPAAIIVETVQGEGGLRAASAEWLRTLESLCRRHEILLIVDDVQAGCGRTGSFFSFEEAGITPDIRVPVEVHLRIGPPPRAHALPPRARPLGAGRAQRHVPREQPGVRHRYGGTEGLLGRSDVPELHGRHHRPPAAPTR